MVCRAKPTPSSPGGPDSLGAEVVGCQAGIVYLQHQASIVHGGRQDLGETMCSVSKHLRGPCDSRLAAFWRVGQSGRVPVVFSSSEDPAGGLAEWWGHDAQAQVTTTPEEKLRCTPQSLWGHCPSCLKFAPSSPTNFTSRLTRHLLQEALNLGPSSRSNLLPGHLSFTALLPGAIVP